MLISEKNDLYRGKPMNININPYMKVQIKNQILEVENFIELLKRAKDKDDGKSYTDEERVEKSLRKASERYIKSLKEFCDIEKAK